MGWAGPLVSEMLAEMGAEVIKVEDTKRFDWWRGSQDAGPPETQPLERAAGYNSVNRGKAGVTLDLSRKEGIELLRRLTAVSDVLVENFSPGVMARLGLPYSELSRVNPRLIMLSMPAIASDGPDAAYRGYGMTIEALSGITSLCSYEEGGPPYMLSNAMGDPVSGLNGTLAVLAALRERQRTGCGQWIEVAEVEGAIPLIAEFFLDYQITGELPLPRGNRSRLFAPHGIYKCAGADNWIAIAITDETQWAQMLSVLDAEELAADSRFSEMASRKTHEKELDAELSQVLAKFEADKLARELRQAGIIASQVSSAPDVIGDDQVQSRDFFVPITRAVVDTHLYPGAVARLSRTPLKADMPAPLLGEHNAEVLGGLLGLKPHELEDLEQAGLIGTKPRAR
jgi:crotonobetainyl-CoA:carnitine CoA-transferase CaiB-like acyl-CoA transferase